MAANIDFVKGNKYFKIELLFFIVIIFLIPILSDLEYAFYEQPSQLSSGAYPTSIIRRLVWGAFKIVVYILFYKIAIQQYLIQKKYLLFSIYFVLFVSFLDFYYLFMYKCISLMPFLPEMMINESNRFLNRPYTFHFNLNYMLKEMIVMSGLAYFINYREQEIRINTMKSLQLQSELSNLKLQIQPHFFFNTLNNIYALALHNSANTAPMVAKLAEMMRYILYDTVNTKVLLKKEVEFLENYVTVQSIRCHNKFRIEFDTQGINDTTYIEPLLLLPYIENTFKHSTDQEKGDGFIEIVICLNNNELTLTTFNNKSNINSTRKGIGMENTQKRLNLLYPNKHSIRIEDGENQYKLSLTVFLS